MRRLFLLLALTLPLLAQNNAGLPPSVHHQFLDKNGKPLIGGKIYTCQAGTTCPGNPLATYKNAGETVTNTNPIILDYTGYADIWLNANSPYKLVATDRNDVQQWTQDNISSNPGSTWVDFTPTNATGSIVSISSQGTSYIHLGKALTVSGSMLLAFTGTPINDMSINGIPYVSTYLQTVACSISVDVGSTYAPAVALILPGTSQIHFRKVDGSNFPNDGTGVFIVFSGTYRVN
jgi:hypothetical protein